MATKVEVENKVEVEVKVENNIEINGLLIPVLYPTNSNGREHVTFILQEPKVQAYFATISPDIVIKKITIMSDYMFGKRLGFLFMDLDCYDRASGKKLAGAVFLRGDSVACLVLIKNKKTGGLYFAKVKQPRVPKGKWIYEIPAGMFEKKNGVGKMAGQMAIELREELGIEVESTGIKTDDPSCQFKYMEELGKFDPSPGATVESITTYWYMVEMTTDEIASLHGRIIANEESNSTEIIKVELDVFSLRKIIETEDAKAMCATLQLMNKYPGFVPLIH